MTARPPALVFLMIACVTALMLSAGNARASRFQVSPVRLDLSARTSSGLLTVRNQSAEPIRFQVTAFEWQQGLGGEMQLSPTADVSFFPSMLIVPPGGARKIRVGALSAQGPTEKTYRVFVEELPPLAQPAAGTPNSVRVLTRMGIPVFLAALNPSSAPRIEGVSLRSGRLGFAVKNQGNTHFLNRILHVAATDSAGKVTFETSMAGWYVLRSGVRLYEVSMPRDACVQLAKITVRLETDQGPADATVAASPAQCAP